MTRLIGLNGKKRRGKDTVFCILQMQNPEQRFHREGFADRLKISFARLFLDPRDSEGNGWTDEECIAFCDHFKERGRIEIPEFRGGNMPGEDATPITTWCIEPTSGRVALQRYGTEMHRDVFGSDFWIDAVLPPPGDWDDPLEIPDADALGERYPNIDVLVITDVRFPNEAQRIKDLKGEIWEIVRPQLDEEESEDGHASEQPLPRNLVDRTIVNDAGLPELIQKVKIAYMEGLYRG